MRYCNNCHRITAGEPLFCNFCGRSYELKLCPHRHPNPRNAEICSQCGSREFSTPHPHTPFWLAVALRVFATLPGILLLMMTILFLIGFVHVFFSNPQLQTQVLAVGLVLALLWYLYLQLPHIIRRSISRLFRRSGRRDHEDGHGH